MKLRLVCILVLWGTATAASGTTISMTPRPAFLLRSGGFVAQDSPASFSVYDSKGTPTARFTTSGVTHAMMSPDEKYLVIGCDNGGIALGDMQTGRQVWSKSPADTRLTYIYDASFSQDGRSCVICGPHDRAVVFDTATGKQVGVVSFPPMTTSTMSAALSPDGSKGVLIDLGEHVYTFDVASGTMQDRGMRGAWPVRYSSDGQYFAFRSSNSGVSEQLRVVDNATLGHSDLGEFQNIGSIRPTDDGKFLVTALSGRRSEPQVVAGFRCDPSSLELEQVWEAPQGSAIEKRTDFDPVTMTGISTSYRLVNLL